MLSSPVMVMPVPDEPFVLSLQDYSLRIPFKVQFSHASAVRSETCTVLVKVRTAEDGTGWGEACPREYVTNESIDSVRNFISRHRESLIHDLQDLASLQSWMAENHVEINANPAAWCALELAFLDGMSRGVGQSVEAYLGLPDLNDEFTYAAVIGSSGRKQFAAILRMYRELGLGDYKIKLSGDKGRDSANLEQLEAAGPGIVRVRADANNLWHDVDEAAAYLKELDFPFFALEEPLKAGRFDDLAVLANELNVKIVLDESFLGVDQLQVLNDTPDCWIVNLRVSKMGGLLRSLDVVGRCREYGIPLIVGAQVGETSLLTRAGLCVLNAAGHSAIAAEGAFGTYLLESDPFQPNLMFGREGVLAVKNFSLSREPGLGLTVDENTIECYID